MRIQNFIASVYLGACCCICIITPTFGWIGTSPNKQLATKPTTTALRGPSHDNLGRPSTSPTLFGNRDIATASTTSTTTSLYAKKAVADSFLKVTSVSSLFKSISTKFIATSVMALKAMQELTATQKGLFLGMFLFGFVCGKIRPIWKPFKSVNDIPGYYFGPNSPPLKGRAISVSDGDTIRFLHTPLPWQYDKNKKYKVTETCLPIRICTYDTPETAKFGKPGQPFGNEAKEELTKLVDGKIVNIRLLQKDQYSRGVACMWVRGTMGGKKYVDEHMLKKGLAEVYVGGGAVYGPLGKDAYLDLQEEAKSNKIGIWSLKNRESAAEYKKRTKK